MIVERIVDSGLVPEAVLRASIRAVCALRLREQRNAKAGARALVEELRKSDIAIETAAANEQHYEVPPAFFERVLGPHLKYSSCYWPDGVATLGSAEVAMLELTAERAGMGANQDVLDLGCGWGSFSLWAAARFPTSRFTAISNSKPQREHIEKRAADRGLTNLTVRTADVRGLDLDAQSYDRIVSIEMFEHMRNYAVLLRRIASWLRPTGALFVHVFAHRRYAYPFTDTGPSDWMAREFFTGGLMPSVDLFRHFQDDLVICDEWQLPGTHYAKTAEAWHANLVGQRAAIEALLGKRAYQRWRVFFLACAELFGYARGNEWLVAHYRFAPR
ncbi:MAG TPA: cyclopropane-fatty-acyl-phospholipid synthase family protein [Kofleriaceae bacterium]|nr:cyclopropane-fatty-acyl-phospholipid synthase family protein [Kofleriaceae bacterium]